MFLSLTLTLCDAKLISGVSGKMCGSRRGETFWRRHDR